MRKYTPIVTLILACLCVYEGHAQERSTNKSESKKQGVYREYKSRSSSTNIDRVLNDATEDKINNPSLALDKIQEALAISVADGNLFNEAKCYLLIAEINEPIPERKLALEN